VTRDSILQNIELVPVLASKIVTGFSSSVTDHIDTKLDLNEHLVQHPASTFFIRVSGDSMLGAGIHDGDILIVDRSLNCKDGSIIIAVFNEELTVRRFFRRKDGVALVAENSKYPDLTITPEMEFIIWGIVTTVIHKV
jgi:DNA polymerase V